MFRFKSVAVAITVACLATACGSSTNAASTNAKAKGAYKIAFIETDPLSGSAWTQSWNRGRQQLAAALHAQTTTVGPIAANNVATQASDLIGRGYNVVVAEDFSYQPFLHTVAQQNPNTKFILIGPNTQTHLSNVSTVYGNLWQVRYAEGVIAGMTTKSNKLGFVTAHSIPSVVAGINGFALGAKSVNPRVTTTVISTGNWYDPAGSTQAAETLAATGADVIAQHEDDTGALLGAQHAHVWEMGSESNTRSVAPQTYLSGSVYNWGPYLISQVRQMMAKTWKATDYSGDLASGLVSLGPINSTVPTDVRTKVKTVITGIDNGSIQVFKGPVYYNNGKVMVPSGKALTSVSDVYAKQTGYVQGITGKVGS